MLDPSLILLFALACLRDAVRALDNKPREAMAFFVLFISLLSAWWMLAILPHTEIYVAIA